MSLATGTHNIPAPAFIYNDHAIQADYSFAEYTDTHRWNASGKIWLDILFVHPENGTPATVRVAKSNLILCQPKEVIEAIVYREVKSFLQYPLPVYDYV
jgi:hypothetical protein